MTSIAAPLKIVCVASVTMYGGILKYAVAVPFSSPRRVPVSNVITIPRKALSHTCRNSAAITLHSATHDPTERSMFPMIMT